MVQKPPHRRSQMQSSRGQLCGTIGHYWYKKNFHLRRVARGKAELVAGSCFSRNPGVRRQAFRRRMSLDYSTRPIRVGVLTDEPLRLEGLQGIFEDRPNGGYAPLLPVRGTLEELLAEPRLTIMVVDLSALSRRVRTEIGRESCRRRE